MSGQTALSDCTVTLSYHKTAYDGKEKTPKITVKNSNGIVSDDDYTVTYADNVKAGNAKVIITAKQEMSSLKEQWKKALLLQKQNRLFRLQARMSGFMSRLQRKFRQMESVISLLKPPLLIWLISMRQQLRVKKLALH